MAKVAIFKPDHLGDFVLSIPAIRAIIQYFGSCDLYIAPYVNFLKEYLFPDTVSFPIELSHLNKTGEHIDEQKILQQLKQYQYVISLRNDTGIRNLFSQLKSKVVMPENNDFLHETYLQKKCATEIIPNYSRFDLFNHKEQKWPSKIVKVGLSVSAGFVSNSWFHYHWISLAQSLIKKGLLVYLIGGPNEKKLLFWLQKEIPLPNEQIIIGSQEIKNFFDQIKVLDVVIGTDSGTLHIISYQCPVLAIFGSSSFKRFAPFGYQHRILTMNLACSPCLQFYLGAYNGCLSRECVALITPEIVEQALFMPQNQGTMKIKHANLIFTSREFYNPL
ncbi:MAG: glycosyltransferase family 9 protein [Gammaproteobacteria bacterium]